MLSGAGIYDSLPTMPEGALPPYFLVASMGHITWCEFTILLLIPLDKKFERISLYAIVIQGLSHGIPALSDTDPYSNPDTTDLHPPHSQLVH